MPLPTIIPQDPNSCELVNSILEEVGVLDINEEDAKEFISRLTVVSIDWLLFLRGLKRLSPEQREIFFDQAYDDGELSSPKGAAVFALNLPDFGEFSIETIEFFSTLLYLLLGKEPPD